jgi:hypothetical protein
MTWGPTIKSNKPWPKSGSIVIMQRDKGYVDHTRSRKPLTDEQFKRKLEYEANRIQAQAPEG